LEYHLRLKKLERAVLAKMGIENRWRGGCSIARLNRARGASGWKSGAWRREASRFFHSRSRGFVDCWRGSGSLLSNVVFAAGRAAIRDVFVGGRPVIEAGQHRLQEEIVRDFADVQRRLWS
jgi:hypothetical protein